jgi:NADH dehydrogenase [ubiquinone] 1 alpha subcomplex assembly factor 7
VTLQDVLINRIRSSGPISVSDYMQDCLLHPIFGYYATRDPLGRAGDFITAPEISQMFGELLGLSLAQAWLDQGRPSPFILAELGPGRGTLMADLLRATRSVPGFHEAAQITLIEASPVFQQLQAQTLSEFDPRWQTTVGNLPDRPLFMVANEFFDALPVRQYVRDAEGWRERRIGLSDGALTFGLAPRALEKSLAHRLKDTQDGDLVEICNSAAAFVQPICQHIATQKGAGLIVDYGDWRSLGNTLQALRNHSPVDVLDGPGTADLTAHVDFEAIALTAKTEGCAYSRLTPQGVFLERLGIANRAQRLARGLDVTALESLISAHRRLTHPEEMGNLFKVLGLFPTDAAPPPGLEA